MVTIFCCSRMIVVFSHAVFLSLTTACGQLLANLLIGRVLHYHNESVSNSNRELQNIEQLPKATGSDLNSGSSSGEESYQVTNMVGSNSLIVKEPTRGLEEPGSPSENVEGYSNHQHSSTETPTEVGEVRPATSMFFLLMGLASIGLVVAGSVLATLSISDTGAFANDSTASDDLGVIYLAKRLVSDAKTVDHGLAMTVGHWFFAVLIVTTAMVVPLLCLCGLLAQLLCPLSGPNRKTIESATRFLYTWQYTEAFALSSIAISCAFQLSDLSGTLFGPLCEGAGSFIAPIVQYGLVDSVTDLQCTVVNSSVEDGSLLLVSGCFTASLLYFFVTRRSKQLEYWAAALNSPNRLEESTSDEPEMLDQ